MEFLKNLNNSLERKYFNNMNEDYINSLDLHDWEKEELLEYIQDPSRLLMEMANFIGNKIVKEPKLPFSFYISNKDAVHGLHGIRAKITWNPSKITSSADGSLALHGDYNYEVGSHKYKPTSKELNIAKDFFKKYKVLMAAVWEKELDADTLYDYLRGFISFNELLNKFEFINNFDVESKELYKFYHCKNLEDLEKWVRKYGIFNMND